MTKKHEMTEHEYIIYKKQHDYSDVVETEQGKINREKATYVQKRRKSEARLQQQLRTITGVEDIDSAEAALDDLPEEEQAAERVRRNARTHKRRLVGLLHHESHAGDGEKE